VLQAWCMEYTVSAGNARKSAANRRNTCNPRSAKSTSTSRHKGLNSHWIWLAGELGFEPRLAESESAVLPLDDSPPSRFSAHSRWRRRAVAETSKSALLGAGCAALL
jgi:hypothetical protein